MLHGQTRYCAPSAFLEEIPEALLLKLNKRVAASRAGQDAYGGSYGSGQSGYAAA